MAESQKNPPIEGVPSTPVKKLSFLQRTTTRFPRASKAVGITAAAAAVVGVVAVVRSKNENDSTDAGTSEDNFSSSTDHPVSEA